VDKSLIKQLGYSFYKNILSKYYDEQPLMIMFKIKSSTNQIYSITYIHKIRIKDFNQYFIDMCIDR
jgi:hypothetical protein